MKARKLGYVGLILTCLLWSACGSIPIQQADRAELPANPQLERGKLEVVEDQTETFASQMLDLSLVLRKSNTMAAAKFFSDPAWVTSFPAQATKRDHPNKLVQRYGWRSAARGKRRMTRKAIAQAWDTFLGHFSRLDDVRINVEKATFDKQGRAGSAILKIFLVGRDSNGHREWFRGTASVALERADPDGWSIRSMVVTHAESLVATADFFSEVSDATGVSVRMPLLGEHNSRPYSFYWHGAAAADYRSGRRHRPIRNFRLSKLSLSQRRKRKVPRGFGSSEGETDIRSKHRRGNRTPVRRY